jgi:hypothetical protein
MASFTIRVELHGASSADYKRLHDAMFAAACRVFVRGDNGVLYVMPTGEYDYQSDTLSVEQVRTNILAIARVVHPTMEPWVFVTQVAARAWSTTPVYAANAA